MFPQLLTGGASKRAGGGGGGRGGGGGGGGGMFPQVYMLKEALIDHRFNRLSTISIIIKIFDVDINNILKYDC
jgi:hypothetical protein